MKLTFRWTLKHPRIRDRRHRGAMKRWERREAKSIAKEIDQKIIEKLVNGST